LSLHNYGPNKTVGNVHVVIMDNVKASDIHALERKISVDIYNKFDIFMTIGIYAYNSDDKSKKINEYLKNIIKEYSSIKQIHGFYVDYKNSTIYFDLIIDFDCSNKVDVKNIIIDKMKLKYPKYEFSVIIDDDISD
jgi:divalent metal cation (Fe/Co/Zn/Cd) transporter